MTHKPIAVTEAGGGFRPLRFYRAPFHSASGKGVGSARCNDRQATPRERRELSVHQRGPPVMPFSIPWVRRSVGLRKFCEVGRRARLYQDTLGLLWDETRA